MIPTFPRFLPLSSGSVDEYCNYIAAYPPYADFNLTNRLSWDHNGQAAVSLLYGNIVLLIPSSTSIRLRTTFIGTSELLSTIKTLMAYTQTKFGSSRLDLIPEHVVNRLPFITEWKATEDTNNHDHVVILNDVQTMSGGNLRHFRRAVRSFVYAHGEEAMFHEIDIRDARIQHSIINVFMQREETKKNDYLHELQALRKLFDMSHDMSFISYGISIRGTLQAFIVCEAMSTHWAIGHFWKADTQLTGIYSYLMHQTAHQLAAKHFSHLNTQQDLGIDGLRLFKRSMACILLRKYTITANALCIS